MFDARELLGQLMQAGPSRSTGNRVGNALGARVSGGGGLGQGSGQGGSGNPLADLLGGLRQDGGGGSLSELLGGGGQGGSGGLGGIAEAARGMLGGAGRTAQQHPLATSGLAALAGAFLGSRSGVPRGAIGGGALALLASLAWSSLRGQDREQGTPSQEDLAREAPLGLREPQNQAEEQELQDTATLIVEAMINAAKADGSIDQREAQRIVGKLQDEGAGTEAREFITAQMNKPQDTESLIAKARTPERAVEVYAASLLAIEVDTPAERDYLRRLANGLGLAPATVQRVHDALGVSAPA